MIDYRIYKFASIEGAVKFMNDNNVPHDLVVSLTPTQFSNGVPSEWTLVINQTSSLPFFSSRIC